MFGAFRPTSSLGGGLLWKIPWRLSTPRKARLRKRLRAVDRVVDVVEAALAKQGLTTKSLERWRTEMPQEWQMRPKDKYTMFDRKEKNYRKGIHSEPRDLSDTLTPRDISHALALKASVRTEQLTSSPELPKWTRVSQRINPPGF